MTERPWTARGSTFRRSRISDSTVIMDPKTVEMRSKRLIVGWSGDLDGMTLSYEMVIMVRSLNKAVARRSSSSKSAVARTHAAPAVIASITRKCRCSKF